MKTRIVIPARFNSTRLPKKLIKEINGKPLIEHVIMRARKIKTNSLIVATDNKVIKTIVDSCNIDCWYSKKYFLNGTDRISFLSKELEYGKNDIVINIQADEFNFPLNGVSKVINYLKKSSTTKVATLIFKNKEKKFFNNKNAVKVMIDKKNHAIIFSRSPIPFNNPLNSFIHIGIYGYRVSILNLYPSLSPCPYEKYERLEQLRFLWNNIKMKCVLINKNTSVSINSLEDLKIARKYKL